MTSLEALRLSLRGNQVESRPGPAGIRGWLAVGDPELPGAGFFVSFDSFWQMIH